MLRHDHFCSFKHHADVEPCNFLVSLAASSISEIYYCNPRSKKCSINSVFAIFFIYTFSPTFLMKAIFQSFAGHSLFMGDNDSWGSNSTNANTFENHAGEEPFKFVDSPGRFLNLYGRLNGESKSGLKTGRGWTHKKLFFFLCDFRMILVLVLSLWNRCFE
jgi:hypothetical protein